MTTKRSVQPAYLRRFTRAYYILNIYYHTYNNRQAPVARIGGMATAVIIVNMQKRMRVVTIRIKAPMGKKIGLSNFASTPHQLPSLYSAFS